MSALQPDAVEGGPRPLVVRRPANPRERVARTTGWVVAAVVTLILLYGLGPR